MGRSSELALGVGGMRVLPLRIAKGLRSEEDENSQILLQRHHLAKEEERVIV